MRDVLWRNQWSHSVSAAMASTMGTARGKTQGSWRPRAFMVTGRPARSTVACGFEIVAVGLKAARK